MMFLEIQITTAIYLDISRVHLLFNRVMLALIWFVYMCKVYDIETNIIIGLQYTVHLCF